MTEQFYQITRYFGATQRRVPMVWVVFDSGASSVSTPQGSRPPP